MRYSCRLGLGDPGRLGVFGDGADFRPLDFYRVLLDTGSFFGGFGVNGNAPIPLLDPGVAGSIPLIYLYKERMCAFLSW